MKSLPFGVKYSHTAITLKPYKRIQGNRDYWGKKGSGTFLAERATKASYFRTYLHESYTVRYCKDSIKPPVAYLSEIMSNNNNISPTKYMTTTTLKCKPIYLGFIKHSLQHVCKFIERRPPLRCYVPAAH